MHALTLHFAPGACSRVPLIALEVIGVPFETQRVAFMKGDHKSAAFKKLNPASKIPVLVVDGKPISQNIAILTWLSATYPDAHILPETKTHMEHAQLLSLLSRFPADLHPLVSRLRVPQFFCDISGGPQRVKELATRSLHEQLASFESKLSEHKWITGDQWTVMDAYLHWVWFRITGAGFEGEAFPNIASHYSRTLEMPAVQRAIQREAEAESELRAKGLMPKFLDTKSTEASSAA